MEQRCVLCNKDISQEEINGAIDRDLWEWHEFRFWEDRFNEHGVLIPPESADYSVIWTERWGWVHWQCEDAYGSGLTPDAVWEKILNNLRG
jgi:hypothetical protein